MIWSLLEEVASTMRTTEIREDLGITNEEVSLRAYELWEQRDQEHGQDVQDWLTAEEQLIGETLYGDVGDVDLEESLATFLDDRESEHG